MVRPNGSMMSMELGEMRSKIIPILNRHGVKRLQFSAHSPDGEEKGGNDIDILIEFTENEESP